MKSLITVSATLDGVNKPMVMLDRKEKLPLEVYLQGADDTNNNGNDGNGNDNKPSKKSNGVTIGATLPRSKLKKIRKYAIESKIFPKQFMKKIMN